MIDKIIKFFNSDPKNTGRQINVDILKTMSIIFIVVSHFVMYTCMSRQDFLYLFAEEFLGGILGAVPAFMFTIGLGIAYSKNREPKTLLYKGIALFAGGYLLNFFGFGIYDLFTAKADFWRDFLYTGMLQLAGLSFMVVALFKKLKLNSFIVLAFSIIISSFAFLFYNLGTGNVIIDSLLSLIVPVSESYVGYSFVSWFIFVTAGIVLGEAIKRIENLDKFYLAAFIPSIIVGTIAIVLYLALSNTRLAFYGMIFPLALGYISLNVAFLCAFHFLEKVLPEIVLRFIETTSRNLLLIYIIHWVVLGLIYFVISRYFYKGLSISLAYVLGLGLFIHAFIHALLYRYFEKAIMDTYGEIFNNGFISAVLAN